MCVYGIHLGGYIGGTAGTITAFVLIWRARKKGIADFKPACR